MAKFYNVAFHSKIFSHNNEKIPSFGYRGALDEKHFQIFFSLPLFEQILIGSDSSLKSPTKYLKTKIRNLEIGVPWIGILILLYLSS